MYADAVVIAGIATVLLMVAFFVGVGIFVIRDSKQPHIGIRKNLDEPVHTGQKH